MPNDNLKTWPEKIWLQAALYEDCDLPSFQDAAENSDGVTWCVDSVQSCEVKYIRADLVPELPTVDEITHVLATVYMHKKSPAFPLNSMAEAVLALLQEKLIDALENRIETNNRSAIAIKKTALQALQENEELKKQLRVARDALKETATCIEAFTGPDGNMPEDTGEFRDLKKCFVAIRALGYAE